MRPTTRQYGSHDPSDDAYGSHDPSDDAYGSHDPSDDAYGSHDPSDDAYGSHDPSDDAVLSAPDSMRPTMCQSSTILMELLDSSLVSQALSPVRELVAFIFESVVSHVDHRITQLG
ncbi:hypothetical protein COCNU_06G013100 [Cocos nucifera]|uniref:Uncharacterized protein n=1 Tax=Cocos nucifera TaxID=13894 RepID=A0A8K0N3B8_COCNU|nr:hypothetical protein COCNU_06G013100 [Cocos nucifera]